MGHIRLGRLPKTQKWSKVIGLLDSAPYDPEAVARSTTQAAEGYLRALVNEPPLPYCFWLLIRVTSAARSQDFVSALGALGVEASESTSVLGFISQLSDVARRRLSETPQSGHLAEFASLAMRRALSETVAEHNQSLFGSSLDDLRLALRTYSTKKRFGLLAKTFFGDFFARTLRYFVSKELSNHVGEDHAIETVAQSHEFTQSVDRYARQSARIMEDFAAGWYSKHNWESQGQISLAESERFVTVALRKLRMELKQEQATQ